MMHIKYDIVTEDNIDFLEELCNKLMTFQADHATIRPDILASMNFNNRLKIDYENSTRKHMVVAFDKEMPVGFAFATIGLVTEKNKQVRPPWAEELEGIGFYPETYKVPKTIGTFKLLYVDANYRTHHIGDRLTRMIMKWLNSHNDVEDLWVYVANGNETVGKFYEKHGFLYNHSVFNGFIDAYRLQKG